MAGIPQEKIDEVLNASNIVEVISEYVQLEKKGKNFFGLCPFHGEKTPSFSVSPEKGIYNCFSCGKGGNAIKFLQDIENISYPEAITKLADKYNIEINYQKPSHFARFDKLFEILELSNKFYSMYLFNTLDGKKALNYLHKRNFSDNIIKQFNIGLSPNAYNVLYKTLNAKEYDNLDLLNSGLIRKSPEGTYYDLFRNRLMFPLKDLKGKIVGYSARILTNDKTQPKYVNSSENNIFKKGEILYNYSDCINDIKREDKVYLFEGFMDVIKACSVGIINSIATMGTALTNDQADRIKEITNNIVICYDGDKAGIEATLKAFNILKNKKFNVTAALFKEGLDPDEFIDKYGKEEFIKVIENSKSIDDFRFNAAYIKSNLKNQSGRNRFSHDVFKIVDSLDNPEANSGIKFIEKLAEIIGITKENAIAEYENYTNQVLRRSKPNQEVVEEDKIEGKFKQAEKNLIDVCLISKKHCLEIYSKLGGSFVLKHGFELINHIRQFYENHDEIKQEELIKNFKPALLTFYRENFTENQFSSIKEITSEFISVNIEHVINFYKYYDLRNELRKRIQNEQDDKKKLKLINEFNMYDKYLK